MSPGNGGFATKKKDLTVVTSASWGRTTPLGSPVEPLVYIIMAVKELGNNHYSFFNGFLS